MTEYMYDVVGIGSPLLDFTVEVHDSILDELDLKKGNMHLVDEKRSREILKRLNDYKKETTPGGSSANTLAGIANMGGKGLLLGKIGKDEYAEYYIQETEKAGTNTKLERHDSMSGHAITLISSDSERTFATHLGAALHFRKDDVAVEDIKRSKILHIEGYLLELPEIREAVLYAMEIAKDANVKISLDVADSALVTRIHDVMDSIIREYIDIVFLNEDEAKSFTGKDEEEALDLLYQLCDVAVVKLGGKGSLIKKDGNIHQIPVYNTDIVNTNGAGDMYAAGVLYGISNNLPIDRAGRIGSYAASLVVAQVGARLLKGINIDDID